MNSRLAYVSVSRGRYDAAIYTNDKAELARDLSRDVSQPTATKIQRAEPAQAREPVAGPDVARGPTGGQSRSAGQGVAM